LRTHCVFLHFVNDICWMNNELHLQNVQFWIRVDACMFLLSFSLGQRIKRHFYFLCVHIFNFFIILCLIDWLICVFNQIEYLITVFTTIYLWAYQQQSGLSVIFPYRHIIYIDQIYFLHYSFLSSFSSFKNNFKRFQYSILIWILWLLKLKLVL
jgi:hypothetical protein